MGRINIYMSDETRAMLQAIAKKQKLKDNRGNLSISAAIRWLAGQYEKLESLTAENEKLRQDNSEWEDRFQTGNDR